MRRGFGALPICHRALANHASGYENEFPLSKAGSEVSSTGSAAALTLRSLVPPSLTGRTIEQHIGCADASMSEICLHFSDIDNRTRRCMPRQRSTFSGRRRAESWIMISDGSDRIVTPSLAYRPNQQKTRVIHRFCSQDCGKALGSTGQPIDRKGNLHSPSPVVQFRPKVVKTRCRRGYPQILFTSLWKISLECEITD